MISNFLSGAGPGGSIISQAGGGMPPRPQLLQSFPHGMRPMMAGAEAAAMGSGRLQGQAAAGLAGGLPGAEALAGEMNDCF